MKTEKRIHNYSWHTMPDEVAIRQFKAHLGDVTKYPLEILPELRRLKTATVDVVEDGYKSTTYLIRETGKCYQIPKCRDSVKRRYNVKPLLFVLYEENGVNFIERLKRPRLKAAYDENKNIFDVTWLDEEPPPMQAIANLKKVRYFLNNK